MFFFISMFFDFLFLRMTKFLKFISPSTAFEAIHSIFTLLRVVINILPCVPKPRASPDFSHSPE